MIKITRAQARLFRAVLRKSIPSGRGRAYGPPVALYAQENGLYLRAHDTDIGVEWSLLGSYTPETMAVQSKALDDVEGARSTEVVLTFNGKDSVKASWEEGGVPQEREYVAVSPDRLTPFPVAPARFAAMEAKLLQALEDAAQTVARESARFALTRLQLRGLAGEIVSTDGGQLLLQRGFKFPWKDEVLVPAIGAFGCKELAQEDQVAIGRTETHVCVRIGAWRFFLTIDKGARYPHVEKVIPSQFSKGTTLHVSPEDAAFLIQALPRLPGKEDLHEQATVDLNVRVAIRAKDAEQSQVTELVLSRSDVLGPPLHFTCNRQYLARAARLGFADFFVKSPEVPIVCRDPQRIYLFMPLSAEGTVPRSKDALRIESTVHDHPTTSSISRPRRRIKLMPAPQPNGHTPHLSPDANGSSMERSPVFTDLLTEAEELRTVLQDASSRLAHLLAGLKQHRRQSRAVQDAVRSLKQLKLDA